MQPSIHPYWYENGPISRDRCVLWEMLDAGATATPEKELVCFSDGSRWTWRQAAEIARRTAAGLKSLGVRRGGHVVLWLPNGPSFLRAWWGASYLGAVPIPLNTAWRGQILKHALRKARPDAIVVHHRLTQFLDDVLAERCPPVIVAGEAPEAPVSFEHRLERWLDDFDWRIEAEKRLTSDDIATVLFTSGTSGPSKGVLCPYEQMAAAGRAAHGYLRPDDRIFVYTPLFHTLGMSTLFAAMAHRASFVLIDGLNAKTLFDDLRRFGCNRIVGLISSMAPYLSRVLDSRPDLVAPFDFAMMSPITSDTIDLARRLEFSYFAAYSMTELSVPILTDVNSTVVGSCGRPRHGVEARIVDPDGNEVPTGSVGELAVRTALRSEANVGYLDDPDATAAAWRDGWFHTGDAFRRDREGNFYFVDRLKDAIRRRGENISSWEVEREIEAFPGVAEAAVIPVPSGLGDDEVMAVVAPLPGAEISPAQLVAFLIPRLAHFMVPRYVRCVDRLPRGATNKVQKSILREIGVTPGTWDRQQHDMKVQRQRLD